MRDDSNFIHYTCVRDVLRNVLPAIQEKLEVASRSLAGFFEAQRKEFPRLYLVEDEDIIQMQYSCVNDPVALRRFLPLMFDGITDVLWGEDEADTRSDVSDETHEIQVFRTSSSNSDFDFHKLEMPGRRGSQIAFLEAAHAGSNAHLDRLSPGSEAKGNLGKSGSASGSNRAATGQRT
eukprot:3352118-Rhodomonas_salina.1